MPILTNSPNLRWFRCIFLGVTLVVTPLEAQSGLRPASEIAQIVDASLLAVIPPEKTLGEASVAERGIRFDFQRTMAAFGYDVDQATARSTLPLRSAVTAGTKALISDCNQLGMMPCKLLGRASYAYLEPVSVSDSEAVVMVHVNWVTSFPKHSYKSGLSMRVHLSRVGSSSWKFDRISGGTIL